MEEIRAEIGAEIVKNNLRREYSSLSKHACKSSRGDRKFPEREAIPDKQNIRPGFFHDTDKIIHSRAYSRYIDKTQVFFLFENDHITHRVLHVQFVSKIARTIGRCLRLNEDLIEAISLGHDLGHVPYGHDGERHLNSICKKYEMGCFCHNAQSVRSLMELENRGNGLNLTLQVLDGILCHNGELLNRVYQPECKKWEEFLEEYEKCWLIEKFDKTIRPMTLEGCVMRVSDVIAYIGRDIEDAITVKLIQREEIPEDVVAVLGNTNDRIINNIVIDIVNNSYGKDCITFSEHVFKALDKLLKFNYQFIYQNPKKQTQDNKVKYMFEYLFEEYMKDLNGCNKESTVYKWHIESMEKCYSLNNPSNKIVLDFIAGMTDDFFNNEFKSRIVPKSFGLTL